MQYNFGIADQLSNFSTALYDGTELDDDALEALDELIGDVRQCEKSNQNLRRLLIIEAKKIGSLESDIRSLNSRIVYLTEKNGEELDGGES